MQKLAILKRSTKLTSGAVDYSPDAINHLLGLTPPEECEVQKLTKDVKHMNRSDWDDVITKLCRPGATWKSTRILTYAYFLPVPKAWASFVIQTVESISFTSEIPLKCVFTVFAILDHKPINVGELIANNIHTIATGKKTILGHGSIINWLCEKQLVQPFEGDLYTPTMKPITDKTMDVFMKKYDEFMRAREGGVHLRHHHSNNHLKWSMERAASRVVTHLSSLCCWSTCLLRPTG